MLLMGSTGPLRGPTAVKASLVKVGKIPMEARKGMRCALWSVIGKTPLLVP